ncbi:hypothetical protein LO772_06520 [Yinghuangia sp. ASG 101]|uniref:hypothetical protein n=1 Tax=Yinghuangia sp. ASG 101 TaxID=2896848 RepID=UPI001E40D03F|nr:hypothetical protein [Yinghuangia sp. ASG 101]UGQ13267.1 hypothetical protein LO772_06520 [Yinghuangia sp. ASG 101]
MTRRRPPRSPGPLGLRDASGLLATLLAAVLLALVGPSSPASPASDTPGPTTAIAALTPDAQDARDQPHPRAQATPPGADAAEAAEAPDEAVHTLPVRAPLHTHGGEPYPTALPWPVTADPWYVLAAGGPPGFRAPDRVAEPLVRTAPRADRAPPAPAGI